MKLSYLLEKINNAPIIQYPFPHLWIENFLQPAHLELLLSNYQLHFPPVNGLAELHKTLITLDYKIQSFPGCASSIEDYLNGKPTNKTVEGWGLCYRLNKIHNELIQKLISFLNSKEWHQSIKNKFEIKAETTCFSAIQKQLDKYEISPHPDVRSKAVTYLLSINSKEYTGQDTSLYIYDDPHIPEFFGKHEHLNRCWIPWGYARLVKEVVNTNTLLMFPTSNYSLHAVKLDYNDLVSQRTQIYGNLMYSNPIKTKHIGYERCL